MKKDEIKNNTFEVSIMDTQLEGETLRFNLYNDTLGKITMNNCHLNADPFLSPNAKYCYNGNVKLIIDKEATSFIAVLIINVQDSTIGTLSLRS